MHAGWDVFTDPAIQECQQDKDTSGCCRPVHSAEGVDRRDGAVVARSVERTVGCNLSLNKVARRLDQGVQKTCPTNWQGRLLCNHLAKEGGQRYRQKRWIKGQAIGVLC